MVGDILQPTHLLFVLIVALLVLGPKKLPEVGRSLGSGLRDFRGALTGETPEEPHSAPRPTPEYVHAPPQEPLAPVVEPTVVEPAGIEFEPQAPSTTPQSRSSEPIA
jgi:sec-independent protein translocase protein TatA